MNNFQIELNYRLHSKFSGSNFSQLMQTVDKFLVFDDGMRFELNLQKSGEERFGVETTLAAISEQVKPEIWNQIHQVDLSNQWMKGLNIQIYLVRRTEHWNLSVRCELEEGEERRQDLVKGLNEFVANFNQQADGPDSHTQERERLFGSMLFTEPIVRATRQLFLSGHFSQALNAAVALLCARLGVLMQKNRVKAENISAWFEQVPPRILFPNLAGKRLQLELLGLGKLCAGVLILLESETKSRNPVSDEPTVVLKQLVLIGMLLERLEGAILNPAKKAAKTTQASRAPKNPKARVAGKKTKKAKKAQPVKLTGKITFRKIAGIKTKTKGRAFSKKH